MVKWGELRQLAPITQPAQRLVEILWITGLDRNTRLTSQSSIIIRKSMEQPTTVPQHLIG